MRKSLSQMRIVTVLAMLGLFMASVTSVFADNPHFVSASATRSGNNLVVSFKEAGLGTNQQITIQVSAFATATYECINGGGNHPKASNKETVSSTETTSGTFNSGKNGTVNSSLTISPPGPGNFSCPSGQTLVGPIDVSYTNVTVTDTTNDVSTSVPGTF